MFNLLLKHESLIEMPSTRKQKAREKRSRQSDVMSDIENMDVMLGNYQESYKIRDEILVTRILNQSQRDLKGKLIQLVETSSLY